MLACANTSDRYNATFGTDDLNHGMLKRTVMNSPIGGYTNAIRSKHCDTSSGRRYALAVNGIEQDAIQHMFEDKIVGQIDTQKTS